MTSSFTQPAFETQDATTYKTNIDQSIAYLKANTALATTVEAQTGTDAKKLITPKTLSDTITGLNLGSAATKNVGTSVGNIPVLDSGGKLPLDVIPQGSNDYVRLGTSNQIISSGANTLLTNFSVTHSSSSEVAGWWDGSNDRFKPSAGVYLVVYKVGLNSANGLWLNISTRVNGSTTAIGATSFQEQKNTLATGSIQTQVLTTTFIADGNNYLQFYLDHRNGPSSATLDGAYNRTEILIVKVA